MKNWYKLARGPSSPVMTDWDTRTEDPYAWKPSVDNGKGKGNKMTTPGDTSDGGLGGFGADYVTNYTNDNTQNLSQGPPKGYSVVQDPSAKQWVNTDSDSFGMPNVENMNMNKGDYNGVSDDGLMGDDQELGIGIGLTNMINNRMDKKKDPVGIFNQSRAKKSIYDRVADFAR